MQRRTAFQLVAALGATFAMPTLQSAATPNASATSQPVSILSQLPGLKPSPRMPVLFIGHGSPMNVIEDTRWRRGWQALGQQFGSGPGAKYPNRS